MKTLVLANQKGGTGKSAVATQLALYLQRLSRKVVIVDLDHQQNTSAPLRLNPQVTVAPWSATTIFESAPPPALPAAPIVLVPGDDRLSTLERRPDDHNAFASRFRAALKAWNATDVCIVDTNPNPDIRYAAALISADYVLAPIQLNQEAIAGIAGLLGHRRYGIGQIQATLNPRLKFLGILPNMVEATPFQQNNLRDLVTQFGGRLLSRDEGGIRRFGRIQKRSIIAEAQAAGMFVADMGKTSARETWRELKPVFDMILAGMDMAPVEEMPA
jgi:chromosome partitioning protein